MATREYSYRELTSMYKCKCQEHLLVKGGALCEDQ